MTRFYYRTGYKDKYIPRKLIITEDLVPELERIEFNQNKAYGNAYIIIKYFDKEFTFFGIKELVDALDKKGNKDETSKNI